MYYSSSDFLTFLNKHRLRIIIGFEPVPKGAMHYAEIDGCNILEQSLSKPTRAHGTSPNDALWELAKLVAGKNVYQSNKHSAPSMIVVPKMFGLRQRGTLTS
jgi:hypothetical protein